MTKYARIRIPSALPQLDKEFDYAIPDHIKVSFGHLVKIPFGKSSSQKIGLVVGLSDTSEYSERAQSIASLESRFPVISTGQYELAKKLAERSAGSTSDILSAMLPKRSVRAESSCTPSEPIGTLPKIKSEISLTRGDRIYLQPKLISGNEVPDWITKAISLSVESLARGESSLLIVPDFRDLQSLENSLEGFGLSKWAVRVSSDDKSSVRFSNHLRALNGIGIVYGLRASVLAPAKNLGLIFVLDDGDESFNEPSAPYWQARDVALLRQEISQCSLVFCSLSPSSDVVRLTELGYLRHLEADKPKLLGRISSGRSRLDDETYALAAKTLSANRPVLIQIANLGYASAIACKKCNERRVCEHCGSGIWIDTNKQFRCRNCKRNGDLPDCSCGANQTKSIRIGSSSVAAWLEKAFPLASVIHSTGENRITKVDQGNTLVIATPGAEPHVDGGYAVVILADAGSMLGFPSLRALENSSLRWANAASKSATDGVVVFVGLNETLADQARKLDFFDIVSSDYQERKVLGLPPSTRVASVTCKSSGDLALFVNQLRDKIGSRIREITTNQEDQYAFCYSYSDGKELANTLKDLSEAISRNSKSRKPGQRLFRIAMDDYKVI